MASFNKVILIGNMTADPELKQTTGGISVCQFSIAVNRKFGKSEQGQPTVDFINIVAWRKTAEFICQWFKKGNPILICGQLQTRSWTDNQNQKRYATEVIAEEVSFVASVAPNKESEDTATPYINPMQWGNGGNTYNQQLEELPSDETLPF